MSNERRKKRLATRPHLAMALGVLAILPLAAAHSPGADPSHACFQGGGVATPLVLPAFQVHGTLSYVTGFTGLPCASPGPFPSPLTPNAKDWGSHARPCPDVLPGPIAGAYCGPYVLPGAAAHCTWTLVVNTPPTRLMVGWDTNLDGLITVGIPGETHVLGPLAPGSYEFVNPTGGLARLIAFPTNIAWGPMTGAVFPGDISAVGCL